MALARACGERRILSSAARKLIINFLEYTYGCALSLEPIGKDIHRIDCRRFLRLVTWRKTTDVWMPIGSAGRSLCVRTSGDGEIHLPRKNALPPKKRPQRGG